MQASSTHSWYARMFADLITGAAAPWQVSYDTVAEETHPLMGNSPYIGLPSSRFWKTAMAERAAQDWAGLYVPKFRISPAWRIATAGSCFAQHIARHLTARGFRVLDVEPPPPGLSSENARRYGFGIYSGRFGNIYLVRQLLQLAQETVEQFTPAEIVWERNGRYFDALRPSIEPNGFGSPEEAIANRRSHLKRVRHLFARADLFVFTLGLTEGWQHTASGTVFPTAPGTVAGTFDAQKYSFRNFTSEEIKSDFLLFRDLVRRRNPTARFLLTVSPVPLTATASGRHVLLATIHSKSVLRAAAGDLCAQHDDIDYFPSFEIVANPWNEGHFFEPNLRSVTELGVQTVMNVFFAAHGALPTDGETGAAVRRSPELQDTADDAVCEEILLDAFAP